MSELDIYAHQGFGHSAGFGQSPALLIVDFVVGFCDPDMYGGGNITDAIARTRDLLATARAARLPVVFTRVVYAEDGADRTAFCRKVPGLERLTETAPAGQIVADLAPHPGELIIRKTVPSAFFGTALAPWLVSHGVDTVVVTGCTTSGCVRASVVDAMSYNFRVIVARDGVGDRALEPHTANLFDMQQKYADVLGVDEIISHLESTTATERRG